MSIQLLLENWKNCMTLVDFEQLTDFLVRTKAGEKLNKILVIEGNGRTGKTTFVEELKKQFENEWVNYNLNQKIHNEFTPCVKPCNEMAKILETQPKLIICNEFILDENLESNMRLITLNLNVSGRYLYKNQITGKINGNFIVISQPDVLKNNFDNIILRIKFTHVF